MSDEQRKKISDGVKQQHKEGRVRLVGFTDEQRRKAVKKIWRGVNASYVAKHAWVTRKRGSPRKCEYCGTTKAKKFEWANKHHTYRRNLRDYIRMCTSCHRRYDIESNNYGSN